MPTKRPKRQHLAEGRAWRRTTDAVVIRDWGKCHICFHYGAKSADHIVPDTEGGKPTMDNLKAAHGVGSPCPDCSTAAQRPIFCNELRGAMSVERARRRIRELTRLPIEDPKAFRREGREWD